MTKQETERLKKVEDAVVRLEGKVESVDIKVDSLINWIKWSIMAGIALASAIGVIIGAFHK